MSENREELFSFLTIMSVSGMTLILQVKVLPCVFTAKCSEPKAGCGNAAGEEVEQPYLSSRSRNLIQGQMADKVAAQPRSRR